jgi:hypothetical protein
MPLCVVFRMMTFPQGVMLRTGEAHGKKSVSHVSLQSGKCLKIISSYARLEKFSVIVPIC